VRGLALTRGEWGGDTPAMDKTEKNRLLKGLPKIDALVASPRCEAEARTLGRAEVLAICRGAVERAKRRALDNGVAPELDRIDAEIADGCRRARAQMLGPALNGTGVLLHTNLGRAPLGPELFAEAARLVSGYCNLEIDVLERRRGARGVHVSKLLAALCGAEDALVVNNNAAAMYLILRELAAGKRVAVSRGELVQIGGGFRIPEILEGSSAILEEVGTTNITTLDDYARAIGPDLAILLKVHQANFRMSGFVEAPDVRELAALKRDGLYLVSDLGSGNPVPARSGGPKGEPTPREMLEAGADLVCFSCDKMLGGVQGGAVAGRADLVRRLAKNPAMRMLRVDKVTYAMLQIALTRHARGDHDGVLLWALAAPSREAIRARASGLLEACGLGGPVFEVVDSAAAFGGGSTPGEEIPSAAIRIRSRRSADDVARWFQEREPPVIGTVREGLFQLDLRAILPTDEPALAEALRAFAAEEA
jgi:L-seryl-tRNA(Ser) seleniumtransferase